MLDYCYYLVTFVSMSSIYIHIPFCRKVCGYCDFFKSANTKKMEQVLDVMLEELDQQRDFLSTKELRTIYFGGGTPSLLTPRRVEEFMAKMSSIYNIGKVEEVTFEANPDDLTAEYLESLLKSGVNRLSIGVQSFCDDELKFMNRRHSSQQAYYAVKLAREVGFENIAIDLIFGVHGFGGSTLVESVERTIELDVEHIAAYHLTIEDGTLFAQKVKRGEFSPVSEEVSEREYSLLHERLTAAGYDHYEISNYAKRGSYSRHNSVYWSGGEYLGIGAGAHSYDGEVSRRWAVGSVGAYLEGGEKRYESEVLSEVDCLNEMIMLSLRRSSGLDLCDLERRFGIDERCRVQQIAERWINSNDLNLLGERMFIPATRFLLSDMIIESFFENRN